MILAWTGGVSESVRRYRHSMRTSSRLAFGQQSTHRVRANRTFVVEIKQRSRHNAAIVTAITLKNRKPEVLEEIARYGKRLLSTHSHSSCSACFTHTRVRSPGQERPLFWSSRPADRSRFSTADQSPLTMASDSSSSSVGLAAQPARRHIKMRHVVFTAVWTHASIKCSDARLFLNAIFVQLTDATWPACLEASLKISWLKRQAGCVLDATQHKRRTGRANCGVPENL